MSDTYIDELLKSATDEQKAQLLAALADDLDVEIKADPVSDLDELGKAMSGGPSVSTGRGYEADESPDSLEEFAKAVGGGN